MSFRFGEFEIDEAQRSIRLRGRDIPVQPRVFDLLAYLIRNRDRVVSKDELLESLWPGTIVVDGALQRVVSLARSALQEGGKREAIRTFARHGYRFCEDIETDAAPAASATSPEVSGELAAARDAFNRHDWESCASAYTQADAEHPLAGADLERWAQAVQWLSNPSAAFEPLERAVAAHLSQGDRLGAARAANQLTHIAFERLDIAVAKGWHRRAKSLLDEAEPSRELGLLNALAARFALFEGELEAAQTHAERTLGIGTELEDPDLEGLGLLYSGHAFVSLGEIDKGLDYQNEAAAAVLSGTITPWIGSVIYCGVIWACRNRADWSRAAQWTEQFRRWCDRNALTTFPGTCRLHRAEVLGIHGDVSEAEHEINESQAILARWAPWAEGDAFRVLGDLRLAQGRLDDADYAFQRARALGWDPQPGHAMLQLARGRPEAAVSELETSLADRNWANRERRGLLLSHLVIAACAAGRTDRAHAALDELEASPDLWSTPALAAHVHVARAEIARAAGDAETALNEWRQAVRIWREIESPLNVAATQLRMAELMLEIGERDQAGAELEIAQSAFQSADAQPLAETCARLLSQPAR